MASATDDSELAGLDRILLRLAGTEESDLEKVLSRLIPAVIGSLKSPNDSVKKKVLEILAHVNKRVKGQLTIKLPINDLLPLCSMTTPADVPTDKAALIRSFALVYIEMAFERASPQQRLEAVPSLAHLLHLRPPQHRAICLRLIVSGLEAAAGLTTNSLLSSSSSSSSASPARPQPSAVAKSDEAKLTPSEIAVARVVGKWPFLSSEQDATLLLNHFLKYLLYQPPPADPRQKANTPLASANLALLQAQAQTAAPLAAHLAPGLSLSDVKELEEKEGVAPKHLAARKLGILGFLAASSPALLTSKKKPQAIDEEEEGEDETLIAPSVLAQSSERLLLPLIAAASDPNSDVQSRAEEMLKRLCSIDGPRPSLDLEDPDLIRRMMHLFHGTSDDELTIPAQERKQPASLPIKARLMPLFNRSIAAANSFPLTVQTIASCIYGDKTTSSAGGGPPSTNVRLKTLGMEFAVWVFKHAAEHQLRAMGPTMLQGLLETLGPSEGSSSSDSLPQDQASLSLRGFAYQAVGCLAQRIPSLLSSRIDIARLFFKALADEPAGLRSTVSESVSCLAKAFMQTSPTLSDPDAAMTESGDDGDQKQSLEQMLIESIESSKDAVRSCAVQWANRIFPKTHALSRYICILAAGDQKIEVKEEGLKGLGLHHASLSTKDEAAAAVNDILKLDDLILCLREHRPLVFSGSLSDSYRSLPLTPKSYLALLHFAKKCWTQDQGSPSDSISHYLSLMEGALCRDSTGELISAALRGILDVALLDLKSFSTRYAPRLQVLKRYLGHTDASARLATAKIFGAICHSLEDSAIASLLSELTSGIRPGSNSASLRYEDKEGAVMAIGFVLSECTRHSPSPSLSVAVHDAVKALLSTISPSIVSQSAVAASADGGLATAAAISLGFASLRGNLNLSIQQLQNQDVHAAAATASSMDVDGAAAPTEPSTLSRLLSRLSELISDHRDLKSAVRAITASGYLLAGARSASADQRVTGKLITDKLLEALFKLAPSKAEEVQFAAGEAFAFAFGCIPLTADQILLSNFDGLANEFRLLSPTAPPPATPATSPLAVEEEDVLMGDSHKEADDLDAFASRLSILNKLLDELIIHTKQEVRCAATVWLVSLLTFCPAAPELLSVLPRIQTSLGGLLGDPNELTQEMASRGVSLVYTRGDEATRKLLVEDLVSVLQGSGTKAATIKVSGDTRIFEEGALGPSAPPPSSSSSNAAASSSNNNSSSTEGGGGGGGGSLSTYRELCSLATDLGQPDLIYKFMDLAHHQSAVNAKRGAAFGFAAVAKLAGAKLDPTHVAALVPKLYRYQYDPNPKVQDSMVLIWRALIDDPKKTIDAHFDAIISELLKEMGGRLWRNRQAAAGALADLIQGRRWPELRLHIAKVWTMTLRAVDDIKETVRRQALALARSIRGISLRLVDPQQTSVKDCVEAVGQILPLLLSEQGLGSSVAEVRILSLDAITKTVQSTHPPALKPHLPLLIQCMLEGLSNLEDIRLNYVEQHAERLGLDQEKLESARVNAARSSPMGDTLDVCTRYNDAASLEAIVPVLIVNIKRGVGLNTKVGTARFLRSLLSKADKEDVKPHAPNLIRTLTASAKNERSPIVRKAYASAAAQVCKYASDKRLEKVVEEACAMYSQSDADADSKYVGGLILYELLKALPDTFSSIAAPLALPLAFGAKMDADDSNKEVAEIWSKVWEEGVSSEAAAIRLYAPNIVNVLVEGLTGPSWSRKRSCAEAVVQLCKTRGVEDVLQPHVRALLAPLMAELATPRLWEGKESILVALGAFCPLLKNLSSSFAESGSMRLEIVEASFSSAVNRKKASFRTAALTCLHDALESLGPSAPVPLQSKIFVKIGPPLLEACASYYDAKLDAANAKQDGAIGEETTTPSPWPLIESLNCLSLAFSNCSNLIEGQPLCESELKVKDVLVSVLGMPGITWQQSIAAFNACSTIVKTCSDRKLDNLAAEWSTKLLPLVVTVSRAANVHQARTVGLGCIIFLIEAAYNHNAAAEKGVRNDIRESLILFMEQEKSIDLKEKIDKAISLIP